MNLTIQLTPEDYVQSCYIHMRPRPVLKWAGYFVLSLAAIAVVISFYFAFADWEGFFIPIFLIAMLAYLAFLSFVYPTKTRQGNLLAAESLANSLFI